MVGKLQGDLYTLNQGDGEESLVRRSVTIEN